MDFFMLYFIIMVSSLSPLFGVPGAIMLFAGLIGILVSMAAAGESDPISIQYLKLCRWVLPLLLGVGFVMVTIAILIPSWEQMKLLIGGYYLTNIDGIEDLPANVVDLLNSFIAEMKPEVVK